MLPLTYMTTHLIRIGVAFYESQAQAQAREVRRAQKRLTALITYIVDANKKSWFKPRPCLVPPAAPSFAQLFNQLLARNSMLAFMSTVKRRDESASTRALRWACRAANTKDIAIEAVDHSMQQLMHYYPLEAMVFLVR
jgi:nitric oxide synthase oxygenase domain/subunit